MPDLKRISTVLCACCLLAAGAAAAQTESAARHSVFRDYLNPSYAPGGLLRLPGIDFRSSIGFAYGSSSAFGSSGMGYYMGHFSYRLGRSLTLNWDVGVGSYLAGPEGGDGQRLLLPNIDLIYQPGDHMLLRLQFQQGHYGTSRRGDIFPRRF